MIERLNNVIMKLFRGKMINFSNLFKKVSEEELSVIVSKTMIEKMKMVKYATIHFRKDM